MTPEEIHESNGRANATYERTVALGQQIIREYPQMERVINECMCSLWATQVMCGARLGGPFPIPPLLHRTLPDDPKV